MGYSIPNATNNPKIAPDAPALENYTARDDVETLENRRAREVSADFAEAHKAAENATGVVTSDVPKRK